MADTAPPPRSFAARAAAARSVHGPLVFGLDPSPQVLDGWGLPDSPDGLAAFADLALRAAAGAVGFVKPQVAFYERHGWQGMRVLQRLVADARASGILVIVDAKRGDVGTTNDAYAEAFVGPDAPLGGDAVTVHPYLGVDALGSFFDRASASGSCVFVVVRSTNPEGRPLQSARVAGGRSVEAEVLRRIGELNAKLVVGRGSTGAVEPDHQGGTAPVAATGSRAGPIAATAAPLGPIGAVIGPTHGPSDLDLGSSGALFLAPGLGAQGATVEDVAQCFAACPDRVLPAASRSLLSAGPDPVRVQGAIQLLEEDLRRSLSA